MNYKKRRAAVLSAMEDDSVLLLYSGIPVHISADDYFFEADRHFFYLTGLRRDHMILFLQKINGITSECLYIEETDPHSERWTGKMVTADEARELTGIEDIRYTSSFDAKTSRLLSSAPVRYAYFNTFRAQTEDLPDYNAVKAKEFSELYPGITVLNLWPLVTKLRTEKDADEEALLTDAIRITDQALQHVMKTLKPGMKEYQAQAEFEYKIHALGAEDVSFPTIAGSGINGTMMHYETNQDTCHDGSLLLLDLGAKKDGYCADITRTYPVNGRFTPRQRQVYEIVLAANRKIAKTARPGMTTKELNDICKEVLAEGCIRLGLINDASEIGKYYMHSVSHHLGIDVHDVVLPDTVLTPGCVISDEPGLYIDEWEIGIRIEDDLMITEDGCRVLSEDIIRDPDDIEAFMKG